MKEQINLLPKPIQRRRMLNLYNRRLQRLVNGMLWGLVLVLAAQGVYWLVLRQIEFNVQASLSRPGQEFLHLQDTVRTKNVFIAEVLRNVKSHPVSTVEVEQVLKVVPEGLLINEVGFKKDQQAVIVKGRATSRLASITFQKNVEGWPWVRAVEAPLQNFAIGPASEFVFTIFRKEKLP